MRTTNPDQVLKIHENIRYCASPFIRLSRLGYVILASLPGLLWSTDETETAFQGVLGVLDKLGLGDLIFGAGCGPGASVVQRRLHGMTSDGLVGRLGFAP